MLNDRNVETRGLPHGANWAAVPIHDWAGPACSRVLLVGLARQWLQTVPIGGCPRAAVWLTGSCELRCVTGGCMSFGSRGCLVALCRHIYGIFTLEGA